MRKFKRNTVLAGAVAMAFAGGSALAGGPVGTMPFDGDGSGAGFTIDNAGFDAATVELAPCPVGATCSTMTATTAGEFLMREVEVGGQRYIQQILVSPDIDQGDFVYEASVASQGDGDSNAMAAKYTIDGAGINTGVAMYRGALFGSTGGNSFAMEMDQDIGGFQTMSMETLLVPNQGASLFRNGRMEINQGAGQQDFHHVIVAGSYQTFAGTLTAGSESITVAAGEAVSATWIGGTMSGGGPNDPALLAPGQTQYHDARLTDQRDFGLLVYRTNNNANSPGSGNAGGTPNGLVDPQFTQNTATQEARGFSGPDPLLQDTNDMYNLDHGSFVGGADILANGWNEDVFGPAP